MKVAKSKIISFLKLFFGFIGGVVFIILLMIGGFWWEYRSFVDTSRKEIPSQIIYQYPLASKVDPFIGTGGVPWTCAYNFPGVSLPFGMMRLSPETASMITSDKALNTSGYFYGDNKIIGFSHTRLVGTGATDGGHFLVFPVADDTGLLDQPAELSYKYSHENELAYPGYYGIEFPDQGIKAELTGTQRVGYHRYTLSNSANPAILMDITHAL